jgi:hypothetical protein
MHPIRAALVLAIGLSVTLSAQTPATQDGLVVVAELEKTLAKATKQLSDLKAILAAAPPCPVCLVCPPPTVCPTCPPPTVCPTTPPPAPLPVVTTVTTAAELTAALQTGGAIAAVAGTYVGNFTFSVPTAFDGAGATLAPLDVLSPVVTVAGDDVTVRNVRVQLGKADRDAILVGSTMATSADQQPHRVLFEDVTVLPTATGGHRGFSLHGSDITLRRVRVEGFLEQNRDSQAVWINNGPGPYVIEDSHLEASGENILVGGDTIRIQGMVPADITVRNNTLLKPQAWRLKSGSVKNSFELKCATRVLFEGNVLDGNWRDAQSGHMIVLTPRNQYGDSPWCGVTDVVVRGNRSVRHTDGYAVNILGTDNNFPSQQTARIEISGNYFSDSVKGIQVGAGVTDFLKITDNTLPAIRWNLLTFTGFGPLTPLEFARNVALSGEYGVNGDGVSPGVPSLTAYTTGLVWSGNVIEKTPVRWIQWPAGTTLLAPGTLAPLLDASGHYTVGGAGW